MTGETNTGVEPAGITPEVAERVAARRGRRATQQAARAEFAKRRAYGLARRHAAKLRHLAERDADTGSVDGEGTQGWEQATQGGGNT